MAIEIEPLRADHIWRFVEDFPFNEFPVNIWAGKAAVAVEGDEVLGIAGISVIGDTATVGMILSEHMRKHPLFLHKHTLYGIEGLRKQGVTTIRAHAESDTGARWLRRLGFIEDHGWYVKCLA